MRVGARKIPFRQGPLKKTKQSELVASHFLLSGGRRAGTFIGHVQSVTAPPRGQLNRLAQRGDAEERKRAPAKLLGHLRFSRHGQGLYAVPRRRESVEFDLAPSWSECLFCVALCARSANGFGFVTSIRPSAKKKKKPAGANDVALVVKCCNTY